MSQQQEKHDQNYQAKTTTTVVADEGAVAVVNVLGLIVTIFLLPETKGKSLEELSEESHPPRWKGLPLDSLSREVASGSFSIPTAVGEDRQKWSSNP